MNKQELKRLLDGTLFLLITLAAIALLQMWSETVRWPLPPLILIFITIILRPPCHPCEYDHGSIQSFCR